MKPVQQLDAAVGRVLQRGQRPREIRVSFPFLRALVAAIVPVRERSLDSDCYRAVQWATPYGVVPVVAVRAYRRSFVVLKAPPSDAIAGD